MTIPAQIGRYEVLQQVGRGGMGVLYRARDPRLDREVAIKVLSSDLDADEMIRSRFLREGTAAARLQHRNIVTVFEFAEDRGTPYIVMEFLRGRSLASRLQSSPPLTRAEALDTVIQLCAGLDFAHEQGVVHRDVKPGNIWLQEDGSVKLLDFGVARVAASTLTRHGDVIGSASYTAPEQIRGLPVDGRADVFSAGIVLFELLAGRRPFEADSPTAIMKLLLSTSPAPIDGLPHDIPSPVREALARALEKDPEDRYARASEFADELQIASLSLVVESEPPIEDPADTVYVPMPDTASRSWNAADMRGSVEAAPHVAARKARLRAWPPAAIATVALVATAAVGTAAWPLFRRVSERATPGIEVAGPVASRELRVPPSPSPAESIPPAPSTPAASVSPALQAIDLDSTPSGAAILRAGADTGLRTPAQVAMADVTSGVLRLTLRGHVPLDIGTRDLAPGASRTTLRLRQIETAVQVTIRASYPVQVVLGQRVWPASEVHRLTVTGRQTLQLRARDYFLDEQIRIDPANGDTQEHRAPGLGQLEVRSPFERCIVAVAGREIDYPTVRVPIAAGSYSVQLVKCPDGHARQKRVSISAGQTEVLKIQ